MTGRLLKPGSQGSSGSGGSGGDSGDSGDGDLEDVIAAALAEGEGTAFDFPGSGEGGEWSDEDLADVREIMYGKDIGGQKVGGIDNMIATGQIKVDKEAGIYTMDQAIKRYLNELMEDNGITLAQYQALKAFYGIE